MLTVMRHQISIRMAVPACEGLLKLTKWHYTIHSGFTIMTLFKRNIPWGQYSFESQQSFLGSNPEYCGTNLGRVCKEAIALTSTRIWFQSTSFSTKQTNKNIMSLKRQLILSQRKEMYRLEVSGVCVFLVLFAFWRTSKTVVLGTR